MEVNSESEVAKFIYANTECPVCFNFTSSPVNQCFNGHLICSECVTQVTLCPICREDMPKKPIRNIIFEKLVELVYSKCTKVGCNKFFKTKRLMRTHEGNCSLR
jgi:hypothetical protein